MTNATSTNTIVETLEAYLEETYESWNYNAEEDCYEYEHEDGYMALFCANHPADTAAALRNAGVEI